MKTCAIVLLLVALAIPVAAATVHDESSNGDLSTDPNAPTALALAMGSNVVIGTTGNPGVIDRDYVTFTLAPGQILVGLVLVSLSPDNLAFASFNAGATSFVPSGATAASFLAGIHPAGANVGSNLMPLFVSSSVTGNSLATPDLGPGTYSFLFQQTSPITQSYSLDFVVTSAVPVQNATWGAIKSLYR
jgi:hypothetical protein